MLKKFCAVTCILFVTVMILVVILDNEIILLKRENFSLPTGITFEEQYSYVLMQAEADKHATPFYFSLNFDSKSNAFSFSLYSYIQSSIENLYYVYTYECYDENVIKSRYVGTPQNFKEFAPFLYLSDDANFHKNTINLFSRIQEIIENDADASLEFPVIYCDSRVFNDTGLIYSEE